MNTKILFSFKARRRISSRSRESISTDVKITGTKPVNSSMKTFPPNPVVFDEGTSSTIASHRSTTGKNGARRPSCCSDFSGTPYSKVMLALEEHDLELEAIVHQSAATAASGAGVTPEGNSSIVSVNRDDLQKIALLGNGQFCHVHSVAGYLLHEQDQHDLATPAASGVRKRATYAHKSIDPQRIRDTDELIIAAKDLANEAKILSQLDHKNIIKLRGLCSETFSQSFVEELDFTFDGNRSSSDTSLKSKNNWSFKKGTSTGGLKGYFLVLDVLTEVLSDRLTRQRAYDKKKRVPKKQELYQRIGDTAMGIATGMQYIHSHDIVLRDLKPGNVGFDEEMNVRLFDFGMARKVSECNPEEMCGSPRYMAPEVMNCRGYTLKVDVYSFGIMLFELCTLEVAFANPLKPKKEKRPLLGAMFRTKKARSSRESRGSNRDDNCTVDIESKITTQLFEFYNSVANEGLRPSDNLEKSVLCPKLRALIQECWSANPDSRPSFDEIVPRLSAIFRSP